RVPELKFDSAIVWMKDPSVADNLRLSGITSVMRADPFPAFGHAADHLLRTLNLERPDLPDLWSPDSDEIVVHASSGSVKKIWPHFETLLEKIPNAFVLLPPSPPGRGRRDSQQADAPGEGLNFADLRSSPALRAASPSGRGEVPLTEVSQRLQGCRAYV